MVKIAPMSNSSEQRPHCYWALQRQLASRDFERRQFSVAWQETFGSRQNQHLFVAALAIKVRGFHKMFRGLHIVNTTRNVALPLSMRA